MNESEIKHMIENNLADSRVVIQGDGRHFEAAVICPDFTGKTMLEQHRMVYAVLGDSFQTDAIHALSIKTFTPQEWGSRQDAG